MNQVLILLATMLETLPLMFVFIYVFRHNFRVPIVYIFIAVIVLEGISVVLANQTVLFMTEMAYSRFISSMLALCLQLILIQILTNLELSQTIFITFLMNDVVDVISLFLDVIVHKGVMDASRMTGRSVVILAVLVAVITPLFYYFLLREVQPLIDMTRKMKIWELICPIPFFIYLIYRLSISPNYFNQGNAWFPEMRAVPWVWGLGTMAIFYFIIRALRTMYDKVTLEEEVNVSNMLKSTTEKQYQAIQNYIEANRKNRHDFRHSLLLIQKYAKEEQYEKIMEVIQGYVDVMDLGEVQPICENHALSMVLQHYKEIAEQNGVSAAFAAEVPAKLEIPETELCVLIGNLAENAVEACRRQTAGEKYIKADIRKVGTEMLSIQMENSYEGKIRKKNGQFISSKRAEFGIGLSSVRDIAEQHHGVVKVTYEGQVFRVNILMNC